MMFRRIVLLCLSLFLLCFVFTACEKPTPTEATVSADSEGLSVDDFKCIQKDMYIWEVVEILGYPGEASGSGFLYWHYTFEDNKIAVIHFLQLYPDKGSGYVVHSVRIFDENKNLIYQG